METRVRWTPAIAATAETPPSDLMIEAAGSMQANVAICATSASPLVAKLQTDRPKGLRYADVMLEFWVIQALAHANISQAELARRLAGRLGRNIDRAAVNKMTTGKRAVAGDELVAIEDITKFPAPTGASSKLTLVPQMSWVSAGSMSTQDPVKLEDAITFLGFPDLPPGDWIALEVQGDSMDRVSPPGSVIILNRKDTRLVADKFYVFTDLKTHETTFKRYKPRPDRFVPLSTNSDHEPIYPEGEIAVVGRVWRTMLDLK